jgi:hypothetical protein
MHQETDNSQPAPTRRRFADLSSIEQESVARSMSATGEWAELHATAKRLIKNQAEYRALRRSDRTLARMWLDDKSKTAADVMWAAYRMMWP